MSEEGKITETRETGKFDRIRLEGYGTVKVTQGSGHTVTVHADADVMPRVITEVTDGVLVLGLKREGWLEGLRRKKLSMRFDVTVEFIRELTLSGVGRIDTSEIRADEMDVVVSGAGAIEIGALEAKSLGVVLSGAGSCEIAGKVSSQTLKLSGAGSYMASELDSETASVVVSGAGDATIMVRDTLDAKVSGSGSIRYHGGATVRQRVTGVGSIRCVCDE
ncbi:MAG: DUF2807 domain-containing protein [Candidatus Eisenbacteria bacterium]|nr:DUF2807 domain-containing protein [Candidatus Eisenbacteria bacterium]